MDSRIARACAGETPAGDAQGDSPMVNEPRSPEAGEPNDAGDGGMIKDFLPLGLVVISASCGRWIL